jgi:hypothetical protein
MLQLGRLIFKDRQNRPCYQTDIADDRIHWRGRRLRENAEACVEAFSADGGRRSGSRHDCLTSEFIFSNEMLEDSGWSSHGGGVGQDEISMMEVKRMHFWKWSSLRNCSTFNCVPFLSTHLFLSSSSHQCTCVALRKQGLAHVAIL